MTGSKIDVTAYKLDLRPTLVEMKTAQTRIAKAKKYGERNDEGIAVITKEVKTLILRDLRAKAMRVAAAAEARKAAREKELNPQPISAFALDLRTHNLQTERDRAGALNNKQLAERLREITADPANMDRDVASIYASAARSRGIKEPGSDQLVADTVALAIDTPAWHYDPEWQALDNISRDMKEWETHMDGCRGGLNEDPVMPCTERSVIEPSMLHFSTVYDTIAKREDVPVPSEGGAIGGGPQVVAKMRAAGMDMSDYPIGGAPNVL